MNDEFLGRAWVPLTLAGMVSIVVAAIAFDNPPLGFAAAEVIVAISFLMRFTWDKRLNPYYILIISTMIVFHIIAVVALRPYLSRGPGGVFMIVALIDGLLMTLIVRASLKSR